MVAKIGIGGHTDKGFRIPESLSSSFADYETYITYVQL
jgi:hypothetical protein